MKARSWGKSAALLFSAMLFLLFVPTAQAGEFTVVLSKDKSVVNTPLIVSGAGNWIFAITVQGKVSFVGLNIKNNAGPGDICWHGQKRNPKASFSLTALDIPAADFNACGDQWPDPDLGLNLQSNITTGDSKATVTIVVTYPEP